MASYQVNQPNAAAHSTDAYGNAAPSITEAQAYDSSNASAVPAQQGQGGDDFLKSGVAAFKTPKGILRIIVFFTSLIAFACMANAPFYDWHSSFEFLLAANVLTWLYTLFIIIAYVFRRQIETKCGYMPMVELVCDGIFFVFTFIAACTSAAKCDGVYSSLCSHYGEAPAAIAFSFLTSFALIGLMVLSWLENRKLERSSASA
jgi:hypothetical protein